MRVRISSPNTVSKAQAEVSQGHSREKEAQEIKVEALRRL